MRQIVILLSMVVLLSGCASTEGEIDQSKPTADLSPSEERSKSQSEDHPGSQGSKLKAACVQIKQKLEAEGCNEAVMDGGDFFGIAFKDVNNMHIEDFEVTGYTNDGISYEYNGAYHRPSVSAWGNIKWGDVIRIDVTNESRRPLTSNYYTDSFYLLTDSRTRYKLSKTTDIRYYPNNINPGESATYGVSMPDVKKGDIKYVVAGIGISDQEVIVLVPTPPKMCKGTTQRDWVKDVQKALVDSGEDISTDGLWGPETASSLEETCPEQY